MNRFEQQLSQALRAFIEGGASLVQEPYVLGRLALESEVGLLELAMLHARALEGLSAEHAGVLPREKLQRAWEFFAEVIAPFEMALRGYREVNDELRTFARRLEHVVAERTAELQAAEARFRSLVEHLPAVTYLASQGARPEMTYVSPQIERLLEFTPEEWLTSPDFWLEQIHDADRPRVEAEWEAAHASGAVFRCEYRVWTKARKLLSVRDEAVPLSTPGSPPHRQGMLVDVTDQRLLEAQLRQAQKMEAVGRLAGGIAHDFNNLLTGILSFGRFLLDDLGPTHPSRPDVQEILGAGERAAALTRQLLAFSRKEVFEPTEVDLNQVVANMEKMFRRLIGEDVDLVFTPGKDLGTIRADRGQIEQVLLNLVVNARDAMPNGGKLTLETGVVELEGNFARGQLGARPGTYVQLAVTDTGVGMDREVLARIFEPFFTTKEPGRGTGLGLSTVYGIVKQAEGDLLVYSTPGRGTTFKVYFPRSLEGAQPKLAPPAPRRLGAGFDRSQLVLVVEDDDAVRSVIRRALTSEGLTVLDAATPDAALRLFDQHAERIRLVVTDVVMPQMTGPELARVLSERDPKLNFLFLSGYTGGALVHQGLVDATAAYLQKPFTPERLLEKVFALLEAPRPGAR